MQTSNCELYRFGDFTLDNYRELVALALGNGFVFSRYDDSFLSGTRQILWRHDVEFSPFVALEMAQIEAALGARSTFFFQLHGETYNVLERAVSDVVLQVLALGHSVGIHFDAHYYGVDSEQDLDRYLELDRGYFEAVFRTEIKVFSFHNTNPFILSCEKGSYAGMINVYSRYFKENFSYCADSTGYWRYERLHDVLNDPEIAKLQVLTHDAMWSREVLSPRKRVFHSIDCNAQRVKRWYDATLNRFGARNVDDEVCVDG